MKYFFIFLFLIVKAPFAHAAELSIVVGDVSAGKPITVDVVLDTGGQSINSAETTLSFPKGLVFSGYNQAKSALSIWIKKPSLGEDNTVVFSGITPGGIERMYDPLHPDARAITLVSLEFIPDQTEVRGEFAIVESRILKNDGKGTSLQVKTVPTSVTLQTRASEITYKNTDTTPPEPFSIDIIERSFFGRTPRLALFATSDTGTGIKEYIVKKGYRRPVVVTSPYPVPPSFWGYILTVQAVDYEGNAREASVKIPGNRMLWWVVVGVLFGGYLLYTYHMKQKRVAL